MYRKWAKKLLENLSGCSIDRLGGRSLVLIDRQRASDAWFLYRVQLKSIIEGLGVNLVLDVGANTGQFAQQLRSVYFGEIISYEPVSSAFTQLEEASFADPLWRVRNFALGSSESVQSINVSKATDFSSLLRANDYCAERFGEKSLGAREEPVSVRRLDAVLERDVSDLERKRLFIKMDTQGYDLEVFGGIGSALEHVVALQSEVSLIPIYEGMPHWTVSIATYEKAGFGVAGMFPVTWDSQRVIEYDCLLVRK